MSQLGSFYRKIIFLDSQHIDLAPQADSREVPPHGNVLPHLQIGFGKDLGRGLCT